MCRLRRERVVRSVRLGGALESRLEEAARVSGEPVSKIIRQAIEGQPDLWVAGGLELQARGGIVPDSVSEALACGEKIPCFL